MSAATSLGQVAWEAEVAHWQSLFPPGMRGAVPWSALDKGTKARMEAIGKGVETVVLARLAATKGRGMSEKSLGQVAYEGYWARETEAGVSHWSSDIVYRQRWEAAARAVKAAVLAEHAATKGQGEG